MPELGRFVLLRPEWLWALLPLLLIVVAAARSSAMHRWRQVVAPHLLEHLVVRPHRRWTPRPPHLLAATMALSIAALAGPSWRHEPSPFSEDRAPMVVALELTPRMLVSDVQPNRLQRAKQKISDLVKNRGGARTGLVVWAGSAHLVVPLSDDPAAIEAFVNDLDPDLMPVAGLEPASALARAAELLDRDGTPGTVLFVTAGLPERSAAALAGFTDERRDQLQLLLMATAAGGVTPDGEHSALDRTSIDAVTAASGAVATLFTVDDSDVERILRRSNRHLELAQAEDEEARRRDEGWWLLWPIAAVVAFWFRRGWSVHWES